MTTAATPLRNPVAQWCLDFVERRCGDFVSAALHNHGKSDDAEPPRVTDPRGSAIRPPGVAPVLSLAELDLAIDAQCAADYEHLAVLALLRRERPGTPADRLVLRFVAPSAIRSASRAIGSRWLANDIAIRTPVGLAEVSMLVYRVRRTLHLARVVAAIENLIEMLEVVDDDRSLVLERAALERFEVLDDEDAVIVVGGYRIRFDAAAPYGGPRRDRYLAVMGRAPGTGVDPLWLIGRKLHQGPNRAAARPVEGKPYLLLRLGARPTRQSVREFIDEIRRRHDNRSGEAAARETYASFLSRELDRRRQEVIQATYGHHRKLPVVTPIAIDAAADLEQALTLSDDPPSRFKQLIDAMRKSVTETFGVYIPGIRLRVNREGFPERMYILMLDEVPLGSGVIERDQGLETLDREAHIAAHLHSLILTNLHLFATIDHVTTLLSEAAIERFRGEPGGLPRFVDVIRSLLLEELPIIPIEALVGRYLAFAQRPAVDIAEQLRRVPAVHRHLVRDTESWRVLQLSESFEECVSDGLHGEGDAAFLTLEPERTQDLLAAVRDEVHSERQGTRQVILVKNHRLRPFIRSLLVLEFPHLRVVADREIDGVAGVPPAFATISLDS